MVNMIIVKTHRTLSGSTSDTEDGFPKAVRWTIDNYGNLNLHSDSECLATFPHGKWSAVFRETEKPEPFKAEPAAPVIPGMVFVGHNT